MEVILAGRVADTNDRGERSGLAGHPVDHAGGRVDHHAAIFGVRIDLVEQRVAVGIVGDDGVLPGPADGGRRGWAGGDLGWLIQVGDIDVEDLQVESTARVGCTDIDSLRSRLIGGGVPTNATGGFIERQSIGCEDQFVGQRFVVGIDRECVIAIGPTDESFGDRIGGKTRTVVDETFGQTNVHREGCAVRSAAWIGDDDVDFVSADLVLGRLPYDRAGEAIDGHAGGDRPAGTRVCGQLVAQYVAVVIRRRDDESGLLAERQIDDRDVADFGRRVDIVV